ncbi:MAG: M48 family metallopeptidase [Ardenticatenaceae bacterium]|nr:M48 family metallopeptidase [Ardenticatenaceae bacterium]
MKRWHRWLGGATAIAAAILALAGRGGEQALASGDRLAQAKARRAIGDRNFFLGLVWGWGLLLLLLETGGSARLHSTIAARVRPRWRAAALFFAALVTLIDVGHWPFRYVAGYRVNRRFGLNVQTPPAWLRDQGLSAAIEVGLSTPALLVLSWLMKRAPRRWWLPASGLGLVAGIFLSLLWPVVIAPLFNRYEPVIDPEILARVKRLGEVTGVPLGKVQRVDLGRRTTAANAWVTGLWGTRRVVLGDTLMDRYAPDEVEAVLAHELAHVVHHDVWRQTLIVALGQAAGLFAIARSGEALLARVGRRWGLPTLHEPPSAPLIFLLLSVLAVGALPLLNAGSRWREAAADRYALRVTSNPAALQDFFQALANQNLSDPAPPRWHILLLMSHPPIADRVAMVRRFVATHGV